MADWFRKAGEIWGKADRALGGWLPGGGYGSPLTQYVKERPDLRKPEKRTLQGDIAGVLDSAATFAARTRPSVKSAVEKSPGFVKDTVSAGLNQLPASVNLFGRYYTGIGDRGLEFSKQYKDNLFGMVQEAEKAQPGQLAQLKQEERMMTQFSKEETRPDWKKNANDTLAAVRSDIRRIEGGDIQFRTQAGSKGDTDALGGYGTSLGSAWFTKTPQGGYTANEKYDFVYAGADKKNPEQYGPNPGGIQYPSPSKNFANMAAESLLGRAPRFAQGTSGASPQAFFGRGIVAKMDNDPFNYTLKLNRPQ